MDAQVEPGFSKGAEYDHYRATYAPDAVELLLKNVNVSGKENARILDLAAGTGKFTDALAKRKERYDVVAVEPVAAMRGVLEQKGHASVEVKDGHADSIPMDEASVDAVIVAQAFHWFANLGSLREIHRVLERHGSTGLIWNIEHWNAPRDHTAATQWEATVHDLLWSLKTSDDAPRYRDMQWKKAFDEQVKKTPLSILIASDDQLFALPIAEEKLDWEVRLSKDDAWKRFCTLSQVAVLEGAEKERVQQSFMKAIESADADENGQVTIHGYTHLAWTTKIPAEGRDQLIDVETPGAKRDDP